MADVKQILVVDDHFEMLEFLRSMLELSNQECEVLAVPSAEEGLLEIKQTDFDLLITDVRLPGMSGFELVNRVQKLGKKMPIIMMTAFSTGEGRHEAEELGIFRYFEKPLNAGEVLTAVNLALHGTKTGTTPLSPPSTPDSLPNDLQKRLQALQSDIGASALILAAISGEILVQIGAKNLPNISRLAELVALNLQTSFRLGAELASDEPFTLQHHAGQNTELYFANVGRDYFLGTFFDVRERSGRIGTIWVFTQRAIKDIIPLLPPDDAAAEYAPPVNQLISPAPQPVVNTSPLPVTEDPTSEHHEVAPAPEEEFLDIAPEQLANLLNKSGEESGDVDAFWDEALSADSPANSGRGLSFAEAKRQGLISGELEEDEG